MAAGVKLTTKEFIERGNNLHKNKYTYSNVNYVNASTKIKITCPIHGDFLQVPSSHLSGNGCDKCARDKQSKNLRLTQEEFIERVTELFGDKYDFSNTKYVKRTDDVKYICSTHGEVITKASNLLEGNGCGKCAGKGKTTEEIINLIKGVHGDLYDYSKVKFIKNKIPIILICSEHGEFKSSIDNILQGGCGCPKCIGKGLTNDEWIMKAKVIHGDTYGYDNFIFTKAVDKTIINCPIHGEFLMRPSDHVNGKQGCPKCGQEKRAKEYAYTFEEVLEKAKQVHGEKYDYSLVEYVKMIDNVKIICPQHGMFEQSMHSHINAGSGCIVCGTGWSKHMIHSFILSLQNELTNLNSIELWTIINSNNLSRKLNEMGKLKTLIATPAGSKEREESITAILDTIVKELEDDTEEPTSEPTIPSDDTNKTLTEVEIGELVKVQDKEDETPRVNVIQEIKAYDNVMLTASLDDENVDFLLKNGLKKIWNEVLNDRLDIDLYRNEDGGDNFKIIQKWFFDEYDEAMNLVLPKDYHFKDEKGNLNKPNLMQRLISLRTIREKSYGNWSETGTGKTLAGLLTGRINSEKTGSNGTTLIICNNATVIGWRKSIHECFQCSNVYTKTTIAELNGLDNTMLRGGANYIIVNYEKFQQKNSESFVIDLVYNQKIDYVILDEVHNIKQREHDNESIRRSNVVKLITALRENNPNLMVSAMSATPIINNF